MSFASTPVTKVISMVLETRAICTRKEGAVLTVVMISTN